MSASAASEPGTWKPWSLSPTPPRAGATSAVGGLLPATRSPWSLVLSSPGSPPTMFVGGTPTAMRPLTLLVSSRHLSLIHI
eukprot:6052058-Alexandrium_andersonii.AAC.1